MSYIKAFYLNVDECCAEFIEGVSLLEQSAVNESLYFLNRACMSVTDSHEYLSKYQSYYGFARLLNGDERAIEMCRQSVEISPHDGDICMNLARAEYFLDNRPAALASIDIGLRFSIEHDGLKKLKANMGVRKRKPLPLLPRNHLINSALGKMMRRRRN